MAGITCYNIDGTPLSHLTQWDKNIVLVLKGAETSPEPEIHFSNKKSQKAIMVDPDISRDSISVEVPNVLLEEGYPITVRVYYTYSDGSSRTRYTKFINVLPRAKPDDYVSENPDNDIQYEDGGYYRPVITQTDVNTIEFGFSSSKNGMPDVEAVRVNLPSGNRFGNTSLSFIDLEQNTTQNTYNINGNVSEQEGCSQVMRCPKYLGWKLSGDSRMWLYIGDMVDGEFVPDFVYKINETSSGDINYLNPSHNKFIETDGDKYFWYKIAVDNGVEVLGADEFPSITDVFGVVPDFITDEGNHRTSGDYYSIVLPSGAEYAVLVKNFDSTAMNVSWDSADGAVVSKGASFGFIPEDAGAALLRVPNNCPIENIRIYSGKQVSMRSQKSNIKKMVDGIVNFQWYSRKGILWNDATSTYFDEGRRFVGVPYSSRWFNAHYLGYEITPTTLANALNDPYSIAYDGGQTADGVWTVSGKTEIGSRGGTGYGLSSSVLQCLLNENPYPQSNRGFTFDSNFDVTPAIGAIPGATLINNTLSHSVFLNEIYDDGYSFIEAEDPCVCRTVHTNGMCEPNYLVKKTSVDAINNYAYTAINTDTSGYQNSLLDFDNIEIPGGKVRPWRGHKSVYGSYDKSSNGSGITLTLHNTNTVRVFIPGRSSPVVFNTSIEDKYLDISNVVIADGTYVVDAGDNTIQEKFRYFSSDPVNLHFTEDGTAVFSNDSADYAYASVVGYSNVYNPGLENMLADSMEAKPIVIAAGRRYPDLAADLNRIKSIRGVMFLDRTTSEDDTDSLDCWGRYACVSGSISSNYKKKNSVVIQDTAPEDTSVLWVDTSDVSNDMAASASNEIVLSSPNGTLYRLSVENDGTLTASIL